LRKLSLHRTLALIALLVGCGTLVAGQAGVDQKQLARLKQLFPSAATFSPKEGEPAHFTAYAAGGRGTQGVLGYAFWTTELVPLERGYGGPIAILVGIDLKGTLAGAIVADHHEPYGDFSIDRAEFAAQFKNKDIRDPFRLGQDVDAVSRATITMSSAVRAIRNSARRVARELLPPPDTAKP
jgi:NosR/NirI family transcriptional regulator, nitrous oxide reductase regulator